jgi:hypothetical protein
MKKGLFSLACVVAFCASIQAQQEPIKTDSAPNQSDDSPLSVFLGSVRTRAENKALSLAVDYGKKLAESANQALSLDSVSVSGKHPKYFLLTPDIHLKTGDEDAFQGILAKIKANLVVLPPFIKMRPPGAEHDLLIPDPDGLFHVFTLSAGTETDGRFKTVNGLIELGWEPEWLPKPNGWKIYPGVYMQSGYKFVGNAVASPMTNGVTEGDVDQSSEQENEALGRAKASLEIASPTWNVMNTGLKFGLIGSGAIWYDIINTEVYHSVKGIARVILAPKKYFDLIYEHGAGAPTFNKGDQFSAGITIEF